MMIWLFSFIISNYKLASGPPNKKINIGDWRGYHSDEELTPTAEAERLRGTSIQVSDVRTLVSGYIPKFERCFSFEFLLLN